MTGDEFRARVLAALDEPPSDAEMRDHAVQCADDLAGVYLARIDAIVADEMVDTIVEQRQQYAPRVDDHMDESFGTFPR